MEIGLVLLVIMMGAISILMPIIFWTLNHIEDWVERKYGDDTRKKFLKWVQYVSVGGLIIAFIVICLTTYLDPPFSH